MASGMGYLGPQDQNVHTMQDGTTTGSSTSAQTQSTQAGSTATTSNTYDTTAKAALDKALTGGDFTKTAAVSDAQGAMDAAVQASLKLGMPAISSAAKSSGGYNSTTQDMLNNDLTAKAAASGASVVLGNIKSYQDINNENITAATNAVTATKGVTSTGSSTNDTSTTGSGSNTSTNTSTGNQATSSQGALHDALFGAPNPITGAGSARSGTVICTQMYYDKHLTREEYIADNRYVRNHFNFYTVNGYQYWAVPFVQLMRSNKLVYSIGKFVGVRWSKHMAAHYLPSCKHNITGYIMLTFIAPICFIIGLFVNSTDTKQLWDRSQYRG